MSSALAIKQSAIGNDADWLPLDEAAPLLGEPLRTLRWRCKSSLEKQHLARMYVSREGAGKPVWWIHRSIDPRLSRVPDSLTRAERQRPALLSRHPYHHVERAYRKARWVQRWRALLAEARPVGCTDGETAARVVAEAKQVEGDDFKISVRSLYIWRAAMAERGAAGAAAGVEALVPRYADGGGGEGNAFRSAAAIIRFFELYRTELQLSVKQCHRATLRDAQREGWSWPSSYSATRVWLDKNDDIPLSFLCREGKRAWTKRYMPYSEQDWRLVNPGQFYVSDHHQCDFWVRYKETQIRPWITAVQDCRSRRIVGWHFGPAPHQEAILTALLSAFRQAVPEVLRIDNGKDFTSKTIAGLTKNEVRRLRAEYGREWKEVVRRSRELAALDDPRWDGIVHELGIELIYAIPYSAWSKGTLERFFRTFEEQCGKTFATYTGNRTTTRPESVVVIREGYNGRTVRAGSGSDPTDLALRSESAIPTMDEVRTTIGDWLTIYDETPHFGRGVEGKTPAAVWSSADSLRKANDAALDFMMSVRGAYKVGPNGVSLSVGGTQLSYGGRNAALRPWVGREVLVAVDVQYPARCVAFDPSTRRMIAALEPNKRIHPLATNDDLREAMAATNRERKIAGNAIHNSAKRTLDVTQRLNHDLRQQADELRATGTDGRPPDANIKPVRTGFEGVSIPAPNADQKMDSSAADAMRRLSEFVRKDDPKPKSPSPWSRLSRFVREGNA